MIGVAELRPENAALDDNHLVLNGIFVGNRRAAFCHEFLIYADLLTGSLVFLNNLLGCIRYALAEHLCNLCKIVADQHSGIALENGVGLYEATHIPFILVGVGILAQSNILVPDIHGILYGVISDFSCLFHSVSFYKRGGICKKMPPLAVLLSVLQAKNDQPCDNKHHKTDADDDLSAHACLPPSFCGR